MNKSARPLRYDNDGGDMKAAIDQIKEAGYMVARPGPYHLKVGAANFYPSTGKITVDPATVHPHRGTEAFLDLLKKMYGRSKIEAGGIVLTRP